jgi:hypothetical protein
LDWYDSVFEVIDMRSFSNLWYWIGLAVLWSSVSHWVLGVPHDMILRARREKEGAAMNDLHDLVRVNVNRILYIADVSGSWLFLIGSTVLTFLGLTAFLYDVEISQAVFLLVMPLAILALLTNWTARKIKRDGDRGLKLIRRLIRHRQLTQLIGVVSIFITAMFGMYQNLNVGPLGF